MRRVDGDKGAVAVIVAVLAIVLFGFATLVIDVGAIYYERRQLQNGADAGALAVAQACAGGACGTFAADADTFADRNAIDSAARIPAGGVCGTVSAGLPACTDPPAGLTGLGYVRVTTRTQQPNGSSLLPPVLARIIDPNYDGKDVAASSTVIWGVPDAVQAQLAITFSVCEYDKLTLGPDNDGDGQADDNDGDGHPDRVFATAPYTAAMEHVVYFHGSTSAGECGAGPSGADFPGGFGWLTGNNQCAATIDDGWAPGDTGASATNACKAALNALLGKTILIPVFDGLNGLNGSNGQYHIIGYYGFVLTGWRFPSSPQASAYMGTAPCGSSDTCLSGFFVEVSAPSVAPVGSGQDFGVHVTQLVH